MSCLREVSIVKAGKWHRKRMFTAGPVLTLPASTSHPKAKECLRNWNLLCPTPAPLGPLLSTALECRASWLDAQIWFHLPHPHQNACPLALVQSLSTAFGAFQQQVRLLLKTAPILVLGLEIKIVLTGTEGPSLRTSSHSPASCQWRKGIHSSPL